MKTNEFNICDYTESVLKIAEANNLSTADALDRFLANLAVLREHYKGDPKINYHQLGQKWNALSSEKRNAQISEMRTRLSRYASANKSKRSEA